MLSLSLFHLLTEELEVFVIPDVPPIFVTIVHGNTALATSVTKFYLQSIFDSDFREIQKVSENP